MTETKSITVTGSLEVRSKMISPGNWFDYMHKEFLQVEFKECDALLECIDRARVFLIDYDSQHVAETIDVIEILLSLYFEENDASNLILDLEQEHAAQRIFKRGEISEPLALEHALCRFSPRFMAANRSPPKQKTLGDLNEQEQCDWYGVDPEREDSHSLFLAAMAIREGFSAVRFLREADSYSYLDLGVIFDSDSEPECVVDECTMEAQSVVDDVLFLSQKAVQKASRAMEALSLAENLVSQGQLKNYSDTREVEAVRAAERGALSQNASKAGMASHAVHRELRELAIQLFQEGSFKSTRQAAKEIFPKVQERAHSLGRPFSEDRVEKTVYDWLLQSK